MAKFQAPKGYHFSTDGTPATTWAHFVHVPDSDPAVYEFETNKQTDVAKLRKLAEGDNGYGDIDEVDEDKPKRTTGQKSDKAKGDNTGGNVGNGGGSEAGNGGSTGDPNAGSSGPGTGEPGSGTPE